MVLHSKESASTMSDIENNRPPPAKDSLEFAQSIVDTVREPLLVLDADLRVRSANRSFYQAFGVAPEETEGRLIYELGNGQWDIPRLRTLLEDILPRDNSFRDFEVDARLRGHRPAADAPQRPQDPAAGEPLRADPPRHRGHHRRLAGRGRSRTTPRAIPAHRRGGHRLRHLHVRHARA